MNILVTGGAGFVGTNLIKRLLEMGHTVTSLDNYSTGLTSNHQPGCNYVHTDLREVRDFSKWSPDVVFHMAAIARIQPSFSRPIDYFETNANATLYLSDWCSKNKVPLIYAGSSSKHSGKFKNPYTFSKDIGEDIIKLYQEHFNLDASITRFYNVYGPHQLVEGGYTTLIGAWLKALEDQQEFVIYGDGEQRRDFTHVDDIIDALILIMEKRAYGKEFELGRGKDYSVNEVLKMFNQNATYLPPRKGEARHTLNTCREAKEVLGWTPTRNLKEYLKNELR